MIDFSEAPGSATPLHHLEGLNPAQVEAAQILEGPLIVLAGAGSGKTKMITARIANLIYQRRVEPYRILAVTFTNKAAGEMRERVYRLLEQGSHQDSFLVGTPEIGTFHSVCVRILRRELNRAGFTRPFVIYDDSDQLSLVKSVMKRMDIDPKQVNPKSIQAAINRLKCDGTEPDEMVTNHRSRSEAQVQEIYREYQKDLKTNQALDFGEILCLTYRLLRDNEDLRQKYQRLYRYIHVDEYQDTNRVQYRLISCLTHPEMSGHSNLCVVGDEDQSIYKWRGADIRNILDFERDYPNAKVVKLEQNYRSTQTIISAASDLIRNNRMRKDKTLWTQNPQGEPIVVFGLPDERFEAEAIVEEVRKLSRSDGLSLDDFAIFYRTHAQSRQFEDVLRKFNLPYQVVGGLKFYDRKEIKDVLSYFRAVLNPDDSVSLARVINVPGRGIGDATVEKLEGLAALGAGSLWAALGKAVAGESDLSARVVSKLKTFYELMLKLQDRAKDSTLLDFFHFLLDETAYVTELKKEATVEAQARIENLQELDTVLQEFEIEARRNGLENHSEWIAAFLEQTTLASPTDETFQPSSVKMMTLHSSKGLEFPVVFLVGMEEGLFPSLRAWENPDEEEMEEERRLCYVGMTRARKRLFLSHCAIRRIWGQIHYQDPSRFLSEIPEKYLEIRRVGIAAHQNRNPGLAQLEVDRVEMDLDSLVGQWVEHPDYGQGKIIGESGHGNDLKVEVQFSRGGTRKFLYRFLKQA